MVNSSHNWVTPKDFESCGSCGSLTPRWEAKYSELFIEECQNCHGFSYRGSLDVDLSELYNKKYFTTEYADYIGHSRAHYINFARKWKLLREFLNEPAKVFEIGCAYGYFIDFILRNGAQKAYGIEVDPTIVKECADKFGDYFGVASSSARPSFSYNCLVAWDVWEHLTNPAQYFKELITELDKNGLIAVTTVDCSSWVAKIRGKNWRQIHPPTHLHYPTRESFQKFFDSVGCSIVYHKSFGYYRCLEQYLTPFGLDTAKNSNVPWLKLPIYLNLFDTQLVIAVKN